jgi:hypothetical protein
MSKALQRPSVALTLIGAAYAASVWVVSSLFRGKGVVVAAAATIALILALRSALAGRREILYRLVSTTFAAACGLLLIEGAIRWVPGLLSGAVANAALSGYLSERDGIYKFDPYMGFVMRPDYRRPMYWNGHRWHHATNALGFRGPWMDRADAVFLGDSMVYGHGVEEEETVPTRFARWSGLSSANLGLQGSSPVQDLELLRRIGLRLRPRYVVLCLHPTDVTDALPVYEVSELTRFAGEEGYRPLAIQAHGGKDTVFDVWLKHVALPLATARVVRALAYRAWRPPDVAVSAGGEDAIPEVAFAESKLGWEVLRQAVREIDRESRKAGARVVLFDLGFPPRASEAFEQLALQLGIQYSDAGREALRRAKSGEDVYLRHDGHWTRTG